MNVSKFFSRLFTPSKHTDPAVAAAEAPVLAAAQTAASAAVAHISDPLAELENGIEQLADTYAAKIGGGAGVALTPVLNMGLEFGFQAGKQALASKFGITAPTAEAPAAAAA